MNYLYEQQVAPGQLIEVADGIMWLTMPLPFELDHINLYLIRTNEGWVVVDTGIGTSKTKALWEEIFSQLDAPISGVIVTHLHPDHIGLAGWIADTFDVPFYMLAHVDSCWGYVGLRWPQVGSKMAPDRSMLA